MRKRIIAVVAVAGLAPLAQAVPASAAPGKGADRYNVSKCFIEELERGEPPAQICVTVRGVLKVTETPSGNFHVIDNSTQTFSVAGDGFRGSSTSRSKFKLLLKDGQEQVVHFRDRFTATFDGVTCSGSARLMIVRGDVKKEIFSFSCDGELPEPEPES